MTYVVLSHGRHMHNLKFRAFFHSHGVDDLTTEIQDRSILTRNRLKFTYNMKDWAQGVRMVPQSCWLKSNTSAETSMFCYLSDLYSPLNETKTVPEKNKI